jgi:hypothetical protein
MAEDLFVVTMDGKEAYAKNRSPSRRITPAPLAPRKARPSDILADRRL